MSQVYRQLPPAEDLWQEFDYNPLTGELWRTHSRKGRHGRLFPIAPRKVGHVDDWGYLRCDVFKVSNVLVSRLVWKWVTGEDPGQMQIDHKNRIKTDNRFGNLRLADSAQNQHNIGKQRSRDGGEAKSRYKGVTYVRDRHGNLAYIIARISLYGQRIYLGSFETEEQAYTAYCEAAERLHKEFARVA